ncbi:MAG: alcohol dehydrogenase [Spirochaetes bacterium DG_61]|jgi:L-iditol 2-dehydrogenase|nr:MAG: alcohol dehydrogenase [Spirochaetes bacterium DG_61]
MKAAVYHGIKDIRVEEVPVPEIGEGDILLKVGACAICGTDLKVYLYGYKNFSPPQIIGHEISGQVEDMGSHVTRFEIGDRVTVVPIISCGECYSCRKGWTNLCLTFQKHTEAFGFYHPGGFAEYMVIPEKAIKAGNLIKVPEKVSEEEAAIAEPMACALNGQMLAGVGVGDEVLIIGSGPIGCMHISLAKTLGATKVFVSEINEVRLDLARQFGADYYINPEKDNLEGILKEATGGIGPSVILIAAPSKQAQEQSISIAANRAHIDFFGGLPKDDSTVHLDGNLIHYKELFIHGSSGSTAFQIKTCLDLMSGRRIDGKTFISKIISLEEIPDMMKEIQEGNLLKVVVKP